MGLKDPDQCSRRPVCYNIGRDCYAKTWRLVQLDRGY